MMNEKIYTIMTTKVVTAKPTDSLTNIKNILFKKGYHHIPVVEGKKLLGIITSFDLMKLDKPFSEYDTMQVKDVMTTNVVTLYDHELVGAAAMIFLKHLFHGLPIINEAKELVGIVTTHDILKYQFAKAYPDDVFIKKTRWIANAKV
jgi:CBS domain-containing protein